MVDVDALLVLEMRELDALAAGEAPELLLLVVPTCEGRIDIERSLDERLFELRKRTTKEDGVVRASVSASDVPDGVYEKRVAFPPPAAPPYKTSKAVLLRKSVWGPGFGFQSPSMATPALRGGS